MRFAVLAIALALGPAQAVVEMERALVADGTWRSIAGERSGGWSASVRVSDGGMLTGSARIGNLGYDPYELGGTIVDDHIALTLRGEREGVGAEWVLEGTVFGVRLAGRLLSPDGSIGEWEGWWTPAAAENYGSTLTLRASKLAGRRGTSVWFAVTLDPGHRSIAGVQNDIHVDDETPIDGCVVDQMLGKELFYTRLPADGAIRAVVLSLRDSDGIPAPTVLYRCQVDISSDAALGKHMLRVENVGGSDTDGNAKDIAPIDGAIEVVASDAAGFEAIPDPHEPGYEDSSANGVTNSSAGDGCAIASPSSSQPWWLLFVLTLTSRCSRRGPRSRVDNGSRRGAARAAERRR